MFLLSSGNILKGMIMPIWPAFKMICNDWYGNFFQTIQKRTNCQQMPKQPLWLPFRFDCLESFDTFMHLLFKVLLVLLLSCVGQVKCEFFLKRKCCFRNIFLNIWKEKYSFLFLHLLKGTIVSLLSPFNFFLSKGNSIRKGFQLMKFDYN